ncbi:MAG: 30S ribosomal protein S20 [Candidatus Omnitrophica bacterium]|nr:30S ribosomal protein S20 [Candidatus Omnitrophota bacterium]
MANRRNSIKKIRADEKKRVANRREASAMRTAVRRFEDALTAKKFDEARAFLKALTGKLDKCVRHGLLKENTVNRTKSRAQKRLNLAEAK